MTITFEVHEHEIGYAAAPGHEVWAIGDLHGRSDILGALLHRIWQEPARAEMRVLVQTGDLIDRGPDSLGVVDLMMAARERLLPTFEHVQLMGNHEQMLLVAMFAEDDYWRHQALMTWIANGGKAVLREAWGEEWPDLNKASVWNVFGDHRLLYLKDARSHYVSGGLVFVHAGINPHRDRDTFLAQPWNVYIAGIAHDEHWAWCRISFLKHAGGHAGKFVVHGHTPTDGLQRVGSDVVRLDRLNLDLGSFSTGRGRAARIVGNVVTVFDVTVEAKS